MGVFNDLDSFVFYLKRKFSVLAMLNELFYTQNENNNTI